MELRKTKIDHLIKDGLLAESKKEQFVRFWDAMTTGIAKFSYVKKDGSTRYAMGTVNPDAVKDDLGDDYEYFKEVFPLEKLGDDEISMFGNQNFPNTFHYIDLSSGEGSIRQFTIDTLDFPENQEEGGDE